MDWVLSDYGLAGLMVGGLVYVMSLWIKDKNNTTCAASMMPQVERVLETNSTLLEELKLHQHADREYREKNQEVLNNMILTLSNLTYISQDTLERIKDLNRGVNT